MRAEERPWGDFKQLVLNEKCTVKILTVKPGEELSLQVHKKRDEVWYFFDDGIVEVGEARRRVKEGDVVEIKKGMSHRIIGAEKRVRVIEVSYGEFDEKDEVRLEDKYGRV